MQKFPTFELEKWILRGFENGDIDLVKEASQDPLIPYITSIPSDFSKTSALEYIERQKQRHITGKGYSFAIADIKTNSAIGSDFIILMRVGFLLVIGLLKNFEDRKL
ncbi:MAG: hypothetical protein COB14_08940 [Alphaproteobacteria bacterium]|nr:MAG: hypothetical protein COB14_08940 [Alphaproteobacteria bacterium]